MSKIKVSLIIPALEAGAYIGSLISALGEQTLLPSEIIIIDSSSSDRTVEIATAIGCMVKVIEKEKFNHGGTRNMGATIASGDVLVFMTQDALPVNTYFLMNLIQPIIDDDQVVATTARQIPYHHASPLEKFARSFNYPPVPYIRNFDDIDHLGVKAFFFSNVASAIRKDIFEEVGGFPDNVIMNEDMMFCAKVLQKGYSVAYVANAIVIHSHHYTIRQTFNRYFDIGVALEENKKLLSGVQAGGEGVGFVVEQSRYLMSERLWRWIPISGLEVLAKALGYYLGRNHKYLPCKMIKQLSMHSYYWKC